MKRNQYLVEKGAISQDSYDEAFNENQNALATISEVKQRLEQLENTKNPEIYEKYYKKLLINIKNIIYMSYLTKS